MTYRTKTYIAGDWTGDKNLIDKLHEWNDNANLNLHFLPFFIDARGVFCEVGGGFAQVLPLARALSFHVSHRRSRLTTSTE